MNAKQLIQHLMNDPLICAFLLRGDYLSERKASWIDSKDSDTKISIGSDNDDVANELENEDDVASESKNADNVVSIEEPTFMTEIRFKNDLLQFVIDLILNFSDEEIIHEFKRIQSRINDDLRKDFFSSLISILENGHNKIRLCLIKVIEFRVDPKMAHLFSDDDAKRITEVDVEKQLPIVQARVENLCTRFSDIFLSPNLEFNARDDDSKITPPFIWMKGARALSELLMFLSVGGWLKLNPKDLANIQTFSILLTKLFSNKELGVRFTKKAFQEYFLNQSIDRINTMRKKDLYKLSDKRFSVSERTSNPFDCLIKDVSD